MPQASTRIPWDDFCLVERDDIEGRSTFAGNHPDNFYGHAIQLVMVAAVPVDQGQLFAFG